MTEQEAIAWIHSKLAFGIKPGLERMAWLLEQAGHPEEKIKGIHILGTNGKGSTVHDLQQVLTHAGYEVGTFTSPYIIDFKERISVNGEMIDTHAFRDLVELAKPIVERMPEETDLEPATEFEVITFLMFLYFGQVHPVDVVLVEAGMGGQHDSTAVFQPLATIITSIGLDHQAVLGQTHTAIAQEKVGALKEGCPLIYATEYEEVAAVFEAEASSKSAQTYRLGRDFQLSSDGTFQSTFGTLEQIQVAMPGHHQLANAALAIETVLLLHHTFPKVDDAAIRAGLSQANWRGRTELVAPHVMIDGAHNNESIDALLAVLKERYADKRIHILFAAINTKPVEEMVQRLSSYEDLTLTTFPYPTAIPLADYPAGYPLEADFHNWLAKITDVAKDDLYVITGSLYFISQVREVLMKRFEA